MPSSSSSAACKLHFLLIPLPEQGHIIPMLSMASHLSALGCVVTFVKAEKAPLATAQALAPVYQPASLKTSTVKKDGVAGQDIDPSSDQKGSLAAHEHCDSEADHASTRATYPLPENGKVARNDAATNVQFWTLPFVGSPAPLTQESSRFEILKHTLGSLEERQGVVEKFVEVSKASNAPISSVVCDVLLCSWVMPLAKRQLITAAAFVPVAGINYYLPYLMKSGKYAESEKLRQLFGLSEMKMPTNPEAVTRMAKVRSVFGKAFDHVEEASHVLFNSFEHLESAILHFLKGSHLNVKFVGPCLPAWEGGDGLGEANKLMFEQAGCAFTPDHSCLSWLDKQERNSVLFISFGSEGILEEEQVEELALGIEGSGHKFLWVVRPDAPLHNLPREEFRKRSGDIGMFVTWAPQRKVLQHSAVGGFLTHCGWNSTLESMICGVPMLCFPLNGDQYSNAQLIASYWKVGLRLGQPQTLVRRAVVERAVQDVMKGNDDLRERVTQLKEAAHQAMSDSRLSIASVVQDIARKAYKEPSD